MRCWRTKPLCRRCMRRWRKDIPRAVLVGAMARQPRWCFGSGPESEVGNSARAAATNRGPLAWRGRCISRGTPERNCRIANTSISERWHGG